MPALSSTYYSVADVLAFPSDGFRYELAYGKLLVSPAPRLTHGRIVMRIAAALAEYCVREGLGEVFCVAADLTWGRDDVLAQPDVFVIGPQDRGVASWSEVRHVPLVAEVLSPSTKSHDRFDKRRVYQDRAVDLYWIIDGEAGFAEVWTPDAQFPVVERERLTWHPSGASVPFVLELSSLFAAAG
jgi:Uma2 family endonuclease